MSVCAVLLVKDEADVVAWTLRHLAGQVDAIVVSDNGSTDGTLALIEEVASESAIPVEVVHDPEVGYYQAEKTSELARRALEQGHRWVVPCDADEFWYATDGRRIGDYLAGLAPDIAYVTARLYNHLPTAMDVSEEEEPNPFLRLGWRQREHGALPKVAARLRPGLEIRQGNHSAWAPGTGLTVGGLVVRHFSWRSAEQYLRKIRNGERAYAATGLPADVGAHWRAFEGKPDEAVTDHFRTWFWSLEPWTDETLLWDPPPGA